MAYDNASLTTPDIKWLGVRPSDLEKYKIPEQCRLEMTKKDMETGKIMLEEDFIKSRPAWGKARARAGHCAGGSAGDRYGLQELEIMLKTGKKAEIRECHRPIAVRVPSL